MHTAEPTQTVWSMAAPMALHMGPSPIQDSPCHVPTLTHQPGPSQHEQLTRGLLPVWLLLSSCCLHQQLLFLTPCTSSRSQLASIHSTCLVWAAK